MRIDKLSFPDIEAIIPLQPEDWPDITKDFRLYLDRDFCHPVKAVIENTIAGVACSIVFKQSAWLAHIIVGTEFRNRGIGFRMTEYLLKYLQERSVESISLIASDMGEPVYKKAGFRIVSEYILYTRKATRKKKEISGRVIPYRDEHYPEIIRLDKEISGESREPLIKLYLGNSFVYHDASGIQGYYLPALGEGPISADTSEAGTGLMNFKYSNIYKAVIPAENPVGRKYLKTLGFAESGIKGKRMLFGKNIDWKPEKYYSRSGGNYG